MTLSLEGRGQGEGETLRLPETFRKNLGSIDSRRDVYKILRRAKLNTVCEEARCPNIGECFSNKTATFMILGDRCTRRCHFCSVTTAKPKPPDPNEPENLADAAEALGLDHIVVTSVDRDDLKDLGANHFATCITALKRRLPNATVELLTSDFKGQKDLIDIVLSAGPHVFGHNTETVERLYRQVRPQSKFETTISVLQYVASKIPPSFTGEGDFGSPKSGEGKPTVKSGLMVGLGETDAEILETMHLQKQIGVQVVTIGQYLRPSLKHWPVARYVPTESYARFVEYGKELGFQNVFAGPFVRSSYHAKETFINANALNVA